MFQVTQKAGKRHSAADAYLRPALKRPNLTVHTRAQATRLILEGMRALGVDYIRNGAVDRIRVEREVILCGGTINSPQLLMLSGIGPADHLTALGIPVVADLPGVGQNLQDHLLLGVAYECKQPITLAGAETFRNLLRYMLFKTGPLASNAFEAWGFLKTKSDLPAPDLQLIYVNHGFTRPTGHGFSIGPSLIRPRSRGRIALLSSDPLEPPLIQPNYFLDDADPQVLVGSVALARRICLAKAFHTDRGSEGLTG